MMSFARILIFFAVAIGLVGCGSQVPSANDFKLPAVGILVSGGHEEAVRPDLPPDQSGALIMNQTGFQIQIAVSNTIVTLPIGQGFLFALPPGAYEFYIYEPDSVPRVHRETLESGKLRYLYVTHFAAGGG